MSPRTYRIAELSRRPRSWLSAGLILSVAVLLAAAGCSTSGGGGGPKMTGGFAVGDTHNVRVGETVTLRMPLRPDGSRAWRVSKWDSGYISIVGRATPVDRSDGGTDLMVTVRARTPGETVIEVTEVAAPGQAPQVRRFRLNIQP